MAIIRPLNEFTCESVVMALEPSRKCASSCTYCFATLNSKHQSKGESKNWDDDGSFERTLEKAYSPSYDPTNIMQWAVRNRLVFGYANTVEPFQNVAQARGLLRLCDAHRIPLFIQTKGLNFFDVTSELKPFADNAVVFVSVPTLDERARKRFEPGTPPIVERLKVIDWLRDHDFFVIGALSPYHEDWCEDPGGLVEELVDHGVNEIFFDRLHLNQRQHRIITDGWVKKYAGGRGLDWVNPGERLDAENKSKAIRHLLEIYDTAIDNDVHFYMTSFDGTVYGRLNTLPTICPPGCFRDAVWWPYNDGIVHHALENMFYYVDDGETEIDIANRDFGDSIAVYWKDALAFMEAFGSIDQEFSRSSLRDVIAIEKKIPDIYKKTYIGEKARMPEFFRALWNNPLKKSFVWRHPWMRIATRPDGTPWLDDEHNLIGLFDPDWSDDGRETREAEEIDSYRRIDHELIDDQRDIE